VSSTTGTEYRNLLVTTDEHAARITLNRPERRNALSLELIEELIAALGAASARPETRAIVLEGAGAAFSAGHDLSEMIGRDEAFFRELFAACTVMMETIHAVPEPVIAKVHGIATAAGCQLVASCDLAVAAAGTRFATPGVNIGLFCTTPMVPLVRAVPPKAALEMLLTGRPIPARRALELGLVNRVVAGAALDAAVQEFTDAILASSPLAVRLGKRAFYEQLALGEAAAYERAVAVMTENALSHDAQEGMRAFLQKRNAVWTGD
jgi:enoyl-CoA hydratase/carnithine racemase